MRVTLDISGGFEDTIRRLNELPGKAVKICKKRCEATAPAINARQRALAPVDPVDGGQMRDSVRWESPRSSSETFASLRFIVGGDVLLPYLDGRSYNAYAVVQETDPTLKHSHGQAGFMTMPVVQAVPGIWAGIAADIDALVARASG